MLVHGIHGVRIIGHALGIAGAKKICPKDKKKSGLQILSISDRHRLASSLNVIQELLRRKKL
jgi:hypothetical protein